MKQLLFLSLTILFLTSCAQRVPFTNKLKEDFDLTPEKLTQVQFFTSSNIILEKSQSTGNQGTGTDGSLVVNSSKTQDRIIIPGNTKCTFEKLGENNEIYVRFELGTGRVLKFAARPTQTSGNYYLVADWKNGGGTVEYGGEKYTVASGGSSAYLQVLLKNFKKTKRKDRVVKGMKV